MAIFCFILGFIFGAALPVLNDLLAMLRKKWDN